LIQEKPVSLQVVVHGYPKAEVNWFKEQTKLKSGKQYKIEKKDNIHSLTILKTNLTDAGTYKVQAINDAGEASSESTLNIQVPPSIVKKLNNMSIKNGESLTLVAKVDGFPNPEYSWSFNEEIFTESEQRKLECKGNFISMNISNCGPTDGGTYKLVAKNDVGSASTEATIDILVPPIFEKTLLDTICKVGQATHFELIVNGQPPPTVKWMKDNKEIAPGDGISFRHSDNIWSLSITETSKEDKGLYCAVAKNSVGEEKTAAKLDIQAPPSFTKKIESTTMLLNSEIRLLCTAKGNPSPTFKWIKDGKVLNTNEHHVLHTENSSTTLTISNIQLNDDGHYEVVAMNEVGETKCEAVLKVNVKPTFVMPLTDIQTIEGEHVKMEVCIDGIPKPETNWYKDNMRIIADDSLSIEFKDDVHVLTIPDAVEEDCGLYSVVASNIVGEARSEAELCVIGSPEFLRNLEDLSVDEKKSFSLCVQVSSKSEVTVKWLLNGVELIPGENISFKNDDLSRVYSLFVKSAMEESAGTYSIIAENKAGSATTSSSIHINSMYLPSNYNGNDFHKLQSEWLTLN
jgi:titin